MTTREGDGIEPGQSEQPDVASPSTRQIGQANAEPSRKQHVCTYENCNKSFTRSDHLQRHKLNHGTGKACPRCSVHFNRPDLLDRHLARHRRKDEEAGGYGLGVVETRKRMWRDPDGNLVTKRPTLSHNNSATNSRQNLPNLENELQKAFNGNTEMSRTIKGPPTSEVKGSHSSPKDRQQISTRPISTEHQWGLDSVIPSNSDIPDTCEFLTNSSWGSQLDSTHNPFDDMFNPDTASSFNMPFTTMNNYDWLFDSNSLNGDYLMPVPSNLTLSQTYQLSTPSSHIHNTVDNPSNQQLDQPQVRGAIQSSSSQNGLPLDPVHAAQLLMVSRGRSQKLDSSLRGTSATASSYETSVGNNSPGNFSVYHSPTNNSQSSVDEHEPLMVPTRAAPTSSSNYLQKPGMAPRKQLPSINQATRNRILDFIVQAGPKTPEGTLITRGHSLLSLSALQKYCDLFFCRFNITYPLLHQPTFEPSRVETLLIISVILLGATYSGKAEHRLAVCIHDVLRAQIFQNAAFQTQPDLWVLQTILLVECFGKSRAGQTQHDLAHLFHGLLINLIRRSDCQVVGHSKYDNSTDLTSNWRSFIDVEERKRLAFLCFLWDTQHAVLFSQSLCMSAFELRSSLPCNPASWEAETAEKWKESYSGEIQTWFLSVLRLYVNPGSTRSSPHLNDLSRLLILHGLMSISWDMKRREQTSLGFVGPTAMEREGRLAESYDAWKADFDTHCMSMTLSLKDNVSLKRDFTRFSTATNAIYHAAHIILNVEIIDLQIYAGATHIIGRPVTRGDYDRSRRIIKQWAHPEESQAAAKAAWHAAHLLKDGIMNLDSWDVNDVFHYPWCLYLATLTCWVFHFAGSDKADRESTTRNLNAGQHADVGSSAQAEMSALVSGMTSVVPSGLWKTAGKFSTGGLTAMIAKHLSTIRWAVVHEGFKILKGLATE